MIVHKQTPAWRATMRSLVWLIALAAFLCVRSPVRAGSTDEIISRLESALAQEAKERAAAKKGTTDYSIMVARVQMAIDSARWQDASAQLNFISEGGHSPEVLRICRELRGQLLLEVAAREDALVGRIEAGVKKAGDACLAAKEERELDSVLRELSELRPADGGFQPERVRAAYSKLNVALNFVARWQDYLAKRAAGKEKEAAAIIQNLIDHNNVYPVIPRSELLSRVETPPLVAPSAVKTSAKELFANTKSLDELDDLVRALRDLENSGAKKEEIHALIEQASLIRDAYNELRAGRYGPAFELYARGVRPRSADSELIMPLQQKLLAKLLPHYLNTPDLPQPAPDETPSDFLLRLSKEARQKQNWDLALRALQTFRAIAYGSMTAPAWLSADITGYSAIVVADKQEKAAQFAEAIREYQTALECNGQNLPVDLITQRLLALRRQHPEAAAEAARQGRKGVRQAEQE